MSRVKLYRIARRTPEKDMGWTSWWFTSIQDAFDFIQSIDVTDRLDCLEDTFEFELTPEGVLDLVQIIDPSVDEFIHEEIDK